MAFANFAPVSMAQTPNLIGAQIADDRMDAEANERKTRMMGQLAKGGASLYNEAMGDSSPIADYLGLSEPTGEFAAAATDYALPEVAGATSGMNTAALTEALRAPAGVGEAAGMFGGAMPELGLAIAPEAAAAGGVDALAGLGLAEAAPLASAGLNTTAAALAPEAAAVLGGAMAPAAGTAAATGLGTALPPLGIALALGSLFGLFG